MGEIKRLRLRYADTCECGVVLDSGEQAGWDRATRQVFCLNCLDSVPDPGVAAAGVPGASLIREYERRHASRERRLRARFPRMGGLLLAILPDSDSTKAFAIGAEGEQRLASRLRQKCPDVLLLHNRRLGIDARFGDIDHIAVAPSGVFIIDAKNYHDAKVRVSRPGLLGDGADRLIIRGRNRTKLVENLKKQLTAVEQALASRPDSFPIPVSAMLCFLDADLPMFKELSIEGSRALGPRHMVRLLNSPGALTAEQRLAIWTHLADRLPSA